MFKLWNAVKEILRSEGDGEEVMIRAWDQTMEDSKIKDGIRSSQSLLFESGSLKIQTAETGGDHHRSDVFDGPGSMIWQLP